MARFNTQPITGSVTAGGTLAGLTQNAFIQLTGTAPYTVTLPSPVLFPGFNQTFYNATSGVITLTTPAGNFVGAGGSGTATVTVPTTSTINLVSDGVNYVVVGEDGTSLTATTGLFSGNVTINGAGAILSVTPQTVTINPGGTSTIDNINIGVTTRGSGAFTSLAANAAVTFTANTASSTTGTGTMVVTGGVGVSGNINSGGTVAAVALSGPLTGTIQTAAQANITSVGNLTSLTVDTTTLVVDATNDRVGIGIASPNGLLNLKGSNGQLVLTNGNTAGGVRLTATDVNYTANGYLAFEGYANEYGRFDSSGNLLINTTTSPTHATTGIFITGSSNRGISWAPTSDTHYVRLEPAVIDGITINGYSGVAFAKGSRSNSTWAEIARFNSSGHLIPATNNTQALGSSSNRWSNYYGTVDNTVNIETNATTAKPTIVFDFGGSQAYDPRLSFFRNSIATYYNAEGLVSTVSAHQPRIDFNPATGECRGLLIEESRSNIFGGNDNLMSAIYLGNVTYNGCNTIQPANILAPDGFYSAIKITENGLNARHETSLVFSPTVATWTVSVFAKAAERSTLSLAIGGFPSATFNLTAGTYVSSGSVTPIMYSVGNGWWRCCITVAVASAGSTIMYMGIELPGDNGFVAHQGDGSSGLYIWGAQAELGGFPTSYVPSVTTFTFRNSTGTFTDPGGFIRTAPINYPRYNHVYDGANWVSAGLLLEPGSTNLLTTSNLYADTFSGEAIWTKTNSSTDVTAPDGSSTTTKAVSGTSGNSYLWRYSSATYTVNSTYTTSFWCRTASGTGSFDITAYPYNSINATVTTTWTRFSITYTPTSGTAPYIGVVAPSLSTTFYFWGWQVELGVFPTSYIPTTGATATRLADGVTTQATTRAQDNAVMYNAAPYLNNQQSTVITTFASLANPTAGGVPGVFELVQSSGTFGGTGQSIKTGGLDMRTNNFYLGDNYALATGYTPSTTVAFTTIAAAYGAANSAVYTNGVAQGTNSAHTVNFNFNMILLGNIDKPAGFNASGSPFGTTGNTYPLNGWMKKWTYYPLRLVNAELADISGT
jgi:hypothetical protein